MQATRRHQQGAIHLGPASLMLFAGILVLAATQSIRAQQDDTGYPSQDAAPAAYSDAGTPQAQSPAADPPARVARLSVVQGNVSVEPASINQFSPAELNYPLTTGDRLWADNDAEAELEAGQLAVRLGEATDLTVTAMTDTLAQFGLAQGSVHLRTFSLDPNTTTELDTPNIAVTVLQPGDVRIDVDPNSDTTLVTLFSGQVEIDGNGLQQTLEPGQRLRLTGTNPVSVESLQPASEDGLDAFSEDRDHAYEGAEDTEESYLDADTIGGADLADNGDWTADSDYGEVWFPNGVAAGWQPYSNGHWTWVAPWGWTWVEAEPWGFAPFHYGRWAQIGGRWGWVPGPPVVHPVYSPGFVVFVGAGTGVTAWFPLGPGEPYAPWYHASTLYLNRVNVSNLYSRNAAQVRSICSDSSRNLYANALGNDHRFMNRPSATVAVSQTSFAAGRPVRSSQMRLNEAQLTSAPLLPHPLVSPERSMVAPAAARAVPPHLGRPALALHEEHNETAAGQARAPQTQPAPIERRSLQTAAPGTQPTRGYQVYGTEAQPSGQAPAPRQQPESEPSRTFYNRSVPPPARPSFDQQREAIQSTDPGRPLEPQQLNNLQQDRPAGQPQTRESAPHPAPAQRSAPPAPRSSPPPAPRSSPPSSSSHSR